MSETNNKLEIKNLSKRFGEKILVLIRLILEPCAAVRNNGGGEKLFAGFVVAHPVISTFLKRSTPPASARTMSPRI